MIKPTKTIKEFREKYSKDALRMEEDFLFIMKEDRENLKRVLEYKDKGYFVMNNQRMFFEFIDYANAIGQEDMFFLITPFGEQYYAYSEVGKANILKHLSEITEKLKRRSECLGSFLNEVYMEKTYNAIIPINFDKDSTLKESEGA